MGLSYRLAAARDALAVRLGFRRLHGPGRVRLAPDAAGVVLLARDVEWFLPHFLDHYFGLGVAHVVVLDNGSNDRTVAIAAAAGPRVTVLRNTLPVRRHEVRMRSMAARMVFRGGWILFADADELDEPPPGVTLAGLLAWCNAQGHTAVLGQVLDLYAPAPTPGAGFAQAVAESTAYANGAIARIGYHDAARIPFHWFLRENRLPDPGVCFLQGGMRREVFGENPMLSKHSLVRNLRGIGLMTHPHCASRVQVADATMLVRHYKLAGDWAARDRAAVAAHAWDYGEDRARLAASAREGFAIAPAAPQVWRGTQALLEEGFLYASPAARAAFSAASTAASPAR